MVDTSMDAGLSILAQSFQVKVCARAEEKLNQEMEHLGEAYLYAFGWDVKFCGAIEEFFEKQQVKNYHQPEYSSIILHLLRNFYNEDCSKVKLIENVFSLHVYWPRFNFASGR